MTKERWVAYFSTTGKISLLSSYVLVSQHIALIVCVFFIYTSKYIGIRTVFLFTLTSMLSLFYLYIVFILLSFSVIANNL